MFERFSADANDVILAAQAEAAAAERGGRTGPPALGIIRLRRPGLARFVPGPPELLLTRARATVTAPPGAVPPAPPVPYSADAEEAIEHASRLTEDAQARTEPEHLLLALLAQRDDTAANRSLTALRADRAALAHRHATAGLPVTAPAGPPAPRPARPRWRPHPGAVTPAVRRTAPGALSRCLSRPGRAGSGCSFTPSRGVRRWKERPRAGDRGCWRRPWSRCATGPGPSWSTGAGNWRKAASTTGPLVTAGRWLSW